MNEQFRYHLGDLVKDRISGLSGIITTRADHLFGCARYWISPQDHKDGKPLDGCWVDEAQIELLEAGAVRAETYRVVAAAPAPAAARAGGPTDQPASHTGPSSAR